MKQFVIKAGICLEKLSDKVVVMLGMIIFFALSYYSMCYTEKLQRYEEIIETHRDSVLWNLLICVSVIVFCVLLYWLGGKLSYEKLYGFAKLMKVAVFLYLVIMGCWWISECHVRPQADASVLCRVAGYVHGGDYGTMHPPGYMCYYPHQYGLLFILEILYSIFGQYHYVAFQYINIFWIVLMVYAAYRIIDLLCGNDYVCIYFSFWVVLCVPLLLYTAFVYGEIPSISLCMVLMWSTLEYCKKGSRLAVVGMVLSALFAGVVRQNSLIVMVAVAIVLFLCGIKKGSYRIILLIAAIILPMFLANAGIRKMYEIRSGEEVLEGVPQITFIMMGLQDTEKGPGWHNGTDVEEYGKYDFDAEATKKADTEWVKVRLNDMWHNKAYAMDFFRRKILSQWNAPEYSTFDMLFRFTCEFQELPQGVQNLFDGKLRTFLDAFMNRYQFVLYISLLVYSICLLFRKNPIENHILLIAIIGGFLFSILWEAKSRYVLPYMLFSLPLAAIGMYNIVNGVTYIMKFLMNLRRNKRISKDMQQEQIAA